MAGVVMADAKVTGFAELEAAFKQLNAQVADKFMMDEMRDGAKIVQAEAKQIVAAEAKETGALEQSIRVKAGSRKRGMLSVLITTNATDNVFTGDTYYGGFIEYGWNKVPTYRGTDGRIYSKRRGSTPTKKMEGVHFMKRAADNKLEQAADAVVAGLWNRIRSAAGQ